MTNAVSNLRVDYREGQVLSAADLVDEQTYLREARQEHAAAAHLWGVAQGLQLSVSEQGLTVSPGVAVDGLGRQLIVPANLLVPPASLTGDPASVWLVYAEEPFDAPQTGTWECGAAAPSRSREVANVRLSFEAKPTPRSPDTSTGDWPVFLGQLSKGADPSYKVDTSLVPYIGLVGAAITAASGTARVSSGADFAVSLSSLVNGDVVFTDALRIGPDGNMQILGDAEWVGDASVQPGAAPPPSGNLGVGFGPALAPPAQASPWTLYHTKVPPAVAGGPTLDQLRIELPGPQDKEDPASLIASVGSSNNGAFQSAFSVASDGSLTVGDLTVGGNLVQSPVQADPADPRFLPAVLNAWVNAVSAASAGYLTVSISGLAASKTGANYTVSYTLTFSNRSGSEVTVNTVVEIVTLGGSPVPPPVTTLPEFPVPANGNYVSARSLTLDKPGMFALALMVIGTAPGGIPLRAQAAQEIQVV